MSKDPNPQAGVSSDDPKNFTVRPPGKLFYVGWIVVLLVLTIATAGLVLAREFWIGRQTSSLAQQAAVGPRVLVRQVGRVAPTREINLPATTRGFDETDIYAKVPGYLKTIRVDKGDRVRAGEVIATIESPETDKQVANYRADYELQKITYQRDQVLYQTQVISHQDYDDQRSRMLQARATLQQYLALQSYEVIRAPFDGIVTARNIDPGHLVPEATASTSSVDAIVSVARSRPIRVFTYVPQNVAPFVRNGDKARVQVDEYPGRSFTGAITRHPEALSPDSRTMLVEVDLPNDDGALYPGMYGSAQFVVAVTTGAPLVPDDALVFRNDKVYVPVVRDNKLHLAEVTLGFDDGVTVQVVKGLDYHDVVAINVGQAAHDGETVQPIMADAAGH